MDESTETEQGDMSTAVDETPDPSYLNPGTNKSDPVDEDDEPDTFPREYVTKLRDESAKYRQRAGKADDLAKRLHVALVTATGRLADATDLPFDEAHLDNPKALTKAIDDLLAAKAHLASRKPIGDVGQGAKPEPVNVSLAGLLRASA